MAGGYKPRIVSGRKVARQLQKTQRVPPIDFGDLPIPVFLREPTMEDLSAMTEGILTDREIAAFIENGSIRANASIDDTQLQPTSLDLRLSKEGYRVQSGFLPEREAVADRLEDVKLYAIDLENGTVLEKGQIYLIRLEEFLELPEGVSARANPKSSTGRLDLFTRVVTDRGSRFDEVPTGYRGPLYLEVVPRSFPIKLRVGSRLNQIRFISGSASLDDAELASRIDGDRLVLDREGGVLTTRHIKVRNGLSLSLDLGTQGDDPQRIVGYRAKDFTTFVDVDQVNAYDAREFWEPIHNCGSAYLVLKPEEFYIFASKERIRIPHDLAGEMVAYDVGIGELRTNYAGFFDPGFGWDSEGRGSQAVLEVRAHDVPFLVEDGQTVCRLTFERMLHPCDRPYGHGEVGSNYQGQSLALSKHFRR